MKDFKGKVAVITGAASGIGRAMANDFAKRGMHVVLADIQEELVSEAAREVAGHGVETLYHVTDVASLASVQALADAAYQRFGAVHMLCNNAGVGIGGPLQSATHRDWEWVIGIDLWGVIHGVEAFVPRMIAGKQGGHIVNTASMAGVIASKGLGIYNTAKYGVVGLSETLQKDLRDEGIGVSVLCPLGVRTGIRQHSQAMRPSDGDEQRAEPPKLDDEYIDAASASRMVLRAIDEGDLYVFTHFEGLEYVERRFERMKRAFLKRRDDIG